MTDISIAEILHLAVDIEKKGATFYATLSHQYNQNQELVNLFSQLNRDEKIHVAKFKKLAENLEYDRLIKQTDESYRYLRATTLNEVFKGQTFKDYENVTPKDALIRALDFEKATLMFYEAMKEILGEIPELDGIISEEKSHIIVLMTVIMSDAKFRGLSDKW